MSFLCMAFVRRQEAPHPSPLRREGGTLSCAPSAHAVAGRGNRREIRSGALQQLDAHVVWCLDEGNPDTRSDSPWGHGEDGTTLGELGECSVNVVDPQPEMVQTKVR